MYFRPQTAVFPEVYEHEPRGPAPIRRRGMYAATRGPRTWQSEPEGRARAFGILVLPGLVLGAFLLVLLFASP